MFPERDNPCSLPLAKLRQCPCTKLNSTDCCPVGMDATPPTRVTAPQDLLYHQDAPPNLLPSFHRAKAKPARGIVPSPALPLPQCTLTDSHSASLKHTSPPGVYASLSSTSHSTWHCVLFPRWGPYASAVLPFTIEFPEWYPDGPPRIEFAPDIWHPMLNHGLLQWGSWWTRREGRDTVEVLEFVKSCFDNEAVVVREVGGWKAGWEEKVRRVVEASHAEEGDGVIRFVELDGPVEKGVRGLMGGEGTTPL